MKHNDAGLIRSINVLDFERRERRREMLELAKYDIDDNLGARIDTLAIEIRLLELMLGKLRKERADMVRNGQLKME